MSQTVSKHSPTLAPAWGKLKAHAAEIEKTHLRTLLADDKRDAALVTEFDGVLLDYSRQRVTGETIDLLEQLAKETNLTAMIAEMYAGKHLNVTEDRAVMHVALRADPADSYTIDGVDVVPQVVAVRKQIAEYADKIRR